MYTGRRRKGVAPNAFGRPVEIGAMVLVFQNDEPYIGEVLQNDGGNVTLKLYQGELSGKWAVAYDGSDNIAIETVAAESLKEEHVFNLTQTGRLPCKVKTLLKEFM